MTPTPLPENELDRLHALIQCRILDTAPEETFDDIVRIAAQVCDTPFAFVSLIDSDRQWFKAKFGLDVSEAPRNYAFCAHTILQADPLIVSDTQLDHRFKDNPFVIADPHIRFYAGVPLTTPEGYGLGSLCVIDQEPRELTAQQIEALEALGRQVKRQLELRRGLTDIARDIGTQIAIERMKDEFITVVSHELRTPLASLKGALELLRTGKLGNLSDKGQRMLEIALTNSDRLIALINNILDLDPQNYQLSKQTYDIADIIQTALESVRAIADESKITISTQLISTQVYADPKRLVQVFEQLLQNAIKFSSQGREISIAIESINNVTNHTSTKPDDQNSGLAERQILIRVQDQGIGIPADQLETIFERFHQIDASNSRPKGGTGLGLAMCRNLVEQHQGRIWAESRLGEGSTFCVVLPCSHISPQ
jgi:signal transduction histidine kinase